MPSVPPADHALTREELRTECERAAREKFGPFVHVILTVRHSLTIAEVQPRTSLRSPFYSSAELMKAIGSDARSSLELLWEKLQRP